MADKQALGIVQNFFAWLASVQREEAFWERLDRLPELMAWAQKQNSPWVLLFGSQELLSIQMLRASDLRVRISDASSWIQALQWLRVLEPKLRVLLPQLQVSASWADAIRPAVHDAAELLADEGWRFSISVGQEDLLVMGRGVKDAAPAGFGPCEFHLPVLVRFLSAIRDGLIR